jgi:hypothetical protein
LKCSKDAQKAEVISSENAMCPLKRIRIKEFKQKSGRLSPHSVPRTGLEPAYRQAGSHRNYCLQGFELTV